MVLFFTDNNSIHRSVTAAIRRPGQKKGAFTAGEGTEQVSAEVHRLPERRIAAAAMAGHTIARRSPEIVVIATVFQDLHGTPDRDDGDVGIIYRCRTADETWMPDVVVGRDITPLSVADTGPADGGCRLIPPPAAAALSAAISVLSPLQVVGVVMNPSHAREGVQEAFRIALETAYHVDRRENRLSGGSHVGETAGLVVDIAHKLRLSFTQRAQLAAAARSAAVRSGVVPDPLRDSGGNALSARTGAVPSRQDRARDVGRLLRELSEWNNEAL